MSLLPGKLPPIEYGRLVGGVLAASDTLPASLDQWRQGVTFTPACNPGHGLAICVDPGDAGDKTIDGVTAPAVFSPFIAYSGKECSTWIESSELRHLARIAFDAQISEAFALQLQTDAAGSGNPSLNNSATDVTPGDGPSSVVATFSGLINAACECGISDIVFHVPLRAVPFLLNARLIKWDPDTKTYRHGPYKVIADCYGEIGPNDVSAQEDGSDAWFYVSGPIQTALSDPLELEGLHVAQNYQSELVEHLAILRFDPCCVQAARACLTTCS